MPLKENFIADYFASSKDTKKYNSAFLIRAIENNSIHLVKEALDAGVDPNKPCSIEEGLEIFGKSEIRSVKYGYKDYNYIKFPLMLAIDRAMNDTNIVDVLFEYGAKISKLPADRAAIALISAKVHLKDIYEDREITDISYVQDYCEGSMFDNMDYHSIFYDNFNIEKANFLVSNSNITSVIKNELEKDHRYILKILEQEGVVSNATALTESAIKNFHAPIGEELKIPRKLHHIWVTHPDSPKELREEDVNNVIRINKEILQETGYSYEHVLWVNDKNLIPESVKNLDPKGIIVREIASLAGSKLYDLIEETIAEKLWGMASDMLRIEIMKQEGGLYMDLNYLLTRSLEPEMHKFDFFSQSFGGLYIDNFFFCSKPNHPVLDEWIENVHQKFTNPLPYIKDVIGTGDTDIMTDLMTANPLCIAYYKASNQYGNTDVILPVNCESIQISSEEYVWETYQNKKGFCLDHQYLRPLFDESSKEDFVMDPMVYDLYEVPSCLGEDLTFGQDGINGRTWAVDNSV